MTYVLDYCKGDYWGLVKYIAYKKKKENMKPTVLLNYIKLSYVKKFVHK